MEEKYCAHCGKKIKAKAKFCPHCGKAQPGFQTNKLGASAKELTEKVTKGLSGLNFSSLKNSRFKAWFTKKRVAGLIAVLLVLFGAQRFISNGGLFAPKTISLSQQVKQPGKHVWYDVKGTASKDAVIKTIFVVGGGKLTAYQIQDNDVTLGRISKLSKRQTIKLAKEQDKKYFDISATEVQNWLDDKNQVGQQNDFFDYDDLKDLLNGRVTIMRISALNEGNAEVKTYPPLENSTYESTSSLNGYDSTGILNPRDYIGPGLIKNIKETTYENPKQQEIDFENISDDSGNKVVGQKFKYQAIDYFDVPEDISNRFYNMLNANQKNQLVEIAKNDANNWENFVDTDDPDFGAAVDRVKGQQWAKFYQSVDTQKLTKGIFGYHPWDEEMKLSGTLSQQIYNQRFIGYYGGEGEVLTKAQTKHQKAVFPEPNK